MWRFYVTILKLNPMGYIFSLILVDRKYIIFRFLSAPIKLYLRKIFKYLMNTFSLHENEI